jgi:hypothetical protein
VWHTDVDKLDGHDLCLEAAERGVKLLAAGEFPQMVEHDRHGFLERGTGLLIRHHEPLFKLGGGRDARRGREPRAAVHELRRVLKRAAACVVEVDEVDEAAANCHVRLFEVFLEQRVKQCLAVILSSES